MLANLNQNRVDAGLRRLHHVWCHVCKQANNHLWFECPHLFCTYCGANHPSWQCDIFNSCQWCGATTHVSGNCDNAKGRQIKAGCRRTCYRCGRFGHIAALCKAVTRRRGRRRRRRFGRRRRRRR